MTITAYAILDTLDAREAGGKAADPFVVVACSCKKLLRVRASALAQTPTRLIGLACPRCFTIHSIPAADLERAFYRLRR